MHGPRRYGYKQGPQQHRGDNRFENMLNMSKIRIFRFEANAIFSDCKLDEKVASSILATVISKASRIGIPEAKAFLKEKREEGTITDDRDQAGEQAALPGPGRGRGGGGRVGVRRRGYRGPAHAGQRSGLSANQLPGGREGGRP